MDDSIQYESTQCAYESTQCDSIKYDHKQVDTSRPGIRVDEGILPLIEALWAAGIETAFSCQGGDATETRRHVTTDSKGSTVTTTTRYYVKNLTGDEPGELIGTGIEESYVSFPTYEDLSSAVRFVADLLDATNHYQFGFYISLHPEYGSSSIMFANCQWGQFSTILKELEDGKGNHLKSSEAK